jgi:hypothetical protein
MKLLLLQLILLTACAHAKPHLWEVCRDACAAQGATAAAVAGTVDGSQLACVCAEPREAT